MASNRILCSTCHKEKLTYVCEGCSHRFCLLHLQEHQQMLIGELDTLIDNHDQFKQTLIEQRRNPRNRTLLQEIDQWERTSIDAVRKRAQECRDVVLAHTITIVEEIDKELTELTAKLTAIRRENEVTEIDLQRLTNELTAMTTQLAQPTKISLRNDTQALLYDLQVIVKAAKQSTAAKYCRWNQHGKVVAGGKGFGQQLNQLFRPCGSLVDWEKNIVVVDSNNHRLVRWEPNANAGTVIAGGNGQGSRIDQLDHPTDFVVDKRDQSVLVADRGNRRVVRWFPRRRIEPQIVIEDVACWGLAMDKERFLYVSDYENHEVGRWKEGEARWTIVSGGNGRGNRLNQLNEPQFLVVDDERSVYVSDRENDRVVKWLRGGKEGLVVAGGKGQGDKQNQLFYSHGIAVDGWKQIYVADWGNHRVVRYREGESEGEVVVGGHGQGHRSDQLSHPTGLALDDDGNLYVSDLGNHRIVRFDLVEE